MSQEIPSSCETWREIRRRPLASTTVMLRYLVDGVASGKIRHGEPLLGECLRVKATGMTARGFNVRSRSGSY